MSIAATPKTQTSTLLVNYTCVMSIPPNDTSLASQSQTTSNEKASKQTQFVHGQSAGQSNNLYEAIGSLAASAHVDLVLSDGSLLNPFNEPITLTSVKRMIIKNNGTDSTLVIGVAATHPWVAWLGGTSPTVKIPHGGRLVLEADPGYAVTSGSADQLRLAHAGDGTAAIAYSIIIEGVDPNQP